MQKITNAGYQLTEIVPLQWVQTLSSGANKPIVIRGVHANGEQSGEYVLKYRGGERMDVGACRRELLAAWLAAEMDISVPEPVVVRVDVSFAQKVPNEIGAILAKSSLGLNFGSRFIEGKTVVQPEVALPQDLLQSAARIFVFDLLTQNSDRRSEKPNSFLADSKIYIIDHELAFAFLSLLPIFANSKPWILSEIDIKTAKNHLFYPDLRTKKEINWEAAINALQQITPQFWHCAHSLLPKDWQDSEEINRIRNHFESIQQNSGTFISEICNKLLG